LVEYQNQRRGKMNPTSNEVTMPVGPHHNVPTEKIAIDCEMMQSNIGQVLGRVSVVNYESETILDTFVCYPKPINITNTNKEFSGIEWNDIDSQNGAQPFLKFMLNSSSFSAIAL
jgi:RNA exonuclease 4